jgi:hypothetical protein
VKKILVFVLLTVAAGLFAQELKWTGYVNSGLGILSSDESGNQPEFAAFGADSEQWGYRFRLNGAFTGKEGNAGVNFRFQSQSRLDLTGGYLALPYLYGWFSLLDNRINVKGGIVDDGTWQSGGAILDDDVGEGLGLLVRGSPIKGLDIGAGAYLINVQSGGNNSILAVPGNFADIRPELQNAKYTFNMAYTMPDVFKFTAAYRTQNKAGTARSAASYNDDPYKYGGRDESSKAIIAARLLAVKNLTLVVEAEIDKLQKYEDTGTFTLYETVGYKIGDLGFGLNAAEYFNNAANADTAVRLNPWLSYGLVNNVIVPRLDPVYFLAGGMDGMTVANKGAPSGKYHRKGYAALYDSDWSLLTIRPSVKFNINPMTFVEIGDAINIMNGPDKTYGDESSLLFNAFYVDLKWSF